MTHEDIINELANKVRSIQRLRFAQFLFDVAMIYGVVRIFMGGNMVELFGRSLSQDNAMIVVFLISIADLALALILRNLRQDGMKLIANLTGRLDDRELALVQKIERY